MIVDFGDLKLPRLVALLLDASNTRALEASQLAAMAAMQPARTELVTAAGTARDDAELLFKAAERIVQWVKA